MMGFGLMGLVFLLPFLLIVVIIAIAVGWRPPQFNDSGAPPQVHRSALDVLKERYARGEIDQEEFLEMRRNLES